MPTVPSSNITPSGFPLPGTGTKAGVLDGLLRPGPRRPRPDSSGMPLSELLGRALAEADGRGYEPPRLAELQDALGADNFRLLLENPKIKEAITLWANASDADRASLAKPIAVLVADEVGQPGLEKRISWEIRKLK
jgi:hypothetical protein